jgi:DNA primase
VEHDCKAEKCPKYTNPQGQELSIYNVLALDSDSETLHITEGELDAIVLQTIIAGPVVAIPGASTWKKHFPFHLAGFTRVLVWADGDDAGSKMAQRIAEHCPQSEVFPMPPGEDVNSMFLREGADYFLNRMEEPCVTS